MSRKTRFIERTRHQGLMKTCRHVLHGLSERWYDFRYNIKTRKFVSITPYGYDGRFNNYSPSPYLAVMSALRRIDRSTLQDTVFLDFGCGAGRVPIVAASMLPFDKVIGLDFIDDFCALARANAAKARLGAECAPIEIVQCDARDFSLPDKNIVAFFYNPFKEDVLHRVLENIRQSFVEHPRRLTIIFLTPTNIEIYREEHGWPMLNESFPTYPHLCNIYSHAAP